MDSELRRGRLVASDNVGHLRASNGCERSVSTFVRRMSLLVKCPIETMRFFSCK